MESQQYPKTGLERGVSSQKRVTDPGLGEGEQGGAHRRGGGGVAGGEREGGEAVRAEHRESCRGKGGWGHM